ncbi:serine/threonine protein phosphatase [Deltaproteobacteria bacterium TL4]
MFVLETEEIKELQTIKGMLFPARMKFRQLIVTGPPCSGKSTTIQKIGGWYEEGCIDLTYHWWNLHTLTLRPREIHLVLPFQGIKKPMAVHEDLWRDIASIPLDLSRIKLPPQKHFFLASNWYQRYVFEFLLLEPEKILELRQTRAKKQTHHIDHNLTLEMVQKQVAIYSQIASHFHASGLNVYIRDDFNSIPKHILTPIE